MDSTRKYKTEEIYKDWGVSYTIRARNEPVTEKCSKNRFEIYSFSFYQSEYESKHLFAW